MIAARLSVNHEFWRKQAAQPRVVTFITAGRCRSAIGPHDMTEDETLRALHSGGAAPSARSQAMIITAQFIGSLLEPPFADTLLHVGLAVVSFTTALAIGAVVYLLALFGPGMRL